MIWMNLIVPIEKQKKRIVKETDNSIKTNTQALKVHK